MQYIQKVVIVRNHTVKRSIVNAIKLGLNVGKVVNVRTAKIVNIKLFKKIQAEALKIIRIHFIQIKRLLWDHHPNIYLK